jgi:NAD(P)-dependent dehydrogenase (short-subunit alcohol dehydrogenase family)
MEQSSRRVALVTGAGGGLGSQVALLFAQRDHDVMMVDVREAELKRASAGLADTAVRVETTAANLAEVSECERAVAQTVARLGRVDILVNAAAILDRRELEDMTGDTFDHVFHINARAPFFLIRAAVADMAKRGWGRVVNVTSVGVYRGGMRMTSAPYEASKAAVSVFTKMYARHGAPHGVLVNAVCPGMIRTPMLTDGTPQTILDEIASVTALKRMAEPIEVARMIAWLCSDENSYTTGAAFDIDGGWIMR